MMNKHVGTLHNMANTESPLCPCCLKLKRPSKYLGNEGSEVPRGKGVRAWVSGHTVGFPNLSTNPNQLCDLGHVSKLL